MFPEILPQGVSYHNIEFNPEDFETDDDIDDLDYDSEEDIGEPEIEIEIEPNYELQIIWKRELLNIERRPWSDRFKIQKKVLYLQNFMRDRQINRVDKTIIENELTELREKMYRRDIFPVYRR